MSPLWHLLIISRVIFKLNGQPQPCNNNASCYDCLRDDFGNSCGWHPTGYCFDVSGNPNAVYLTNCSTAEFPYCNNRTNCMDCVQFPVDSTLQRTSGWICEWDINGSYCFDWSKVDYFSDIDYSDVASHPDDCSEYQDTIDTETEEGSLNVVVIGVIAIAVLCCCIIVIGYYRGCFKCGGDDNITEDPDLEPSMESTSKLSTDPTGPNPSTLTKTTNNTFDQHESIGAQVRGLGVDQSRLEIANNLAYVDPEISSEPSAPPQDQVQPEQVQVNAVQMAPVVTLPPGTSGQVQPQVIYVQPGQQVVYQNQGQGHSQQPVQPVIVVMQQNQPQIGNGVHGQFVVQQQPAYNQVTEALPSYDAVDAAPPSYNDVEEGDTAGYQ